MASPINSLESLEDIISQRRLTVCLYSGGLDGTYLLSWLSQKPLSDIIALTINLGGDELSSELDNICRQFRVKWRVVDKQEEFARDFVAHSIAAQACYLGGHPICASLSRPLLAKTAVEIAYEEGADVILHTADRSQNSLRRFNGALQGLEFKGLFGSPFELSRISREEKRKALQQLGLRGFEEAIYSIDTNLWGREFECAHLDDPECIRIPEELYRWTGHPLSEAAEKLSISFEQGLPVAIDEIKTDITSLIKILQARVGRYGIGRYVGLEEIEGGGKVQEVREMPAATILFDAYRRLESSSVSAECIREKINMEQLWVREAVEGRWYGNLRVASQAFINSIAERVSGSVAYFVSNNGFTVSSVKSQNHLYIRDRASIEH